MMAGLSAGAAQAGSSHGAGEGGARPKFAPYMPLRILPQGPETFSRDLTVSLGGAGASGAGAIAPYFAEALPSARGLHRADSARPGEVAPSPFDPLTGPHPSRAAAMPDGAPVRVTVPPALALLALTTAALGLSAVRGPLRGDADG